MQKHIAQLDPSNFVILKNGPFNPWLAHTPDRACASHIRIIRHIDVEPEDEHIIHFYDVSNVVSKSKYLFMTCQAAYGKGYFKGNLGRIVESEREHYVTQFPFYSKKKEVSRDKEFTIDDETLMAAAYEQLRALNKDLTDLRKRVNDSLTRIEEMEKNRG